MFIARSVCQRGTYERTPASVLASPVCGLQVSTAAGGIMAPGIESELLWRLKLLGMNLVDVWSAVLGRFQDR